MKYYYPTSTLVTSRDIITLWVARMVMTGLYNLGDVPFRHVYVHTKMLDGFGESMSKSKGNGVDPLDIIELYGTDALRFIIVQLATETQDARLPVSNICPHCGKLNPVKQEHMYMRTRKVTCLECKKPFRPGGPWLAEDAELKTAKQGSERFEIGRNFANKLWNAARFIFMNLEGYTADTLKPDDLPLEDRWILSRLATTTKTVTDALEGYHFSDVARRNLRIHLDRVLRLVHRNGQGPAQRPGWQSDSAARAGCSAGRHPSARAACHALCGGIDLAGVQ